VSRNDLNKVNIIYKDKNISFSIDVAIRTSVAAKPGDQDKKTYSFAISNKLVRYDNLGIKEDQWVLLLNYMLTISEWKKAILGKSIKSVNLPTDIKHQESIKDIIGTNNIVKI